MILREDGLHEPLLYKFMPQNKNKKINNHIGTTLTNTY